MWCSKVAASTEPITLLHLEKGPSCPLASFMIPHRISPAVLVDEFLLKFGHKANRHSVHLQVISCQWYSLVHWVKVPLARLPVASNQPSIQDLISNPPILTSRWLRRRKPHILPRSSSRARHPHSFDHSIRPHTWQSTFLGLYPRLTLWLWCNLLCRSLLPVPIKRTSSRRALMT